MNQIMKDLRCGCNPHSDIVAKYNDDTVEIRCKHGRYVRLKVIEGKLQEEKYTEAEEKVLREAFL